MVQQGMMIGWVALHESTLIATCHISPLLLWEEPSTIIVTVEYLLFQSFSDSHFSHWCLASIFRLIHYCRWRRFSCILGLGNRHQDSPTYMHFVLERRLPVLRSSNSADRGQVVGKQVVVEEGGVEVGGLDKGAEAPVYKMLIWWRLSRNPPRFGNGPTKPPSQMGHKGSEAVYRTFRRPLPAPIVCLGKGSWGAE